MLIYYRLLPSHRDPTVVSRVDKALSQLELENPLRRPSETIEILTKCFRDVRLDSQMVTSAFREWIVNHPFLTTERLDGIIANSDTTWEAYDLMVFPLEAQIAHFEKGIELIKEGRAWDPEAKREMIRAEMAAMRAV